MVQDIRDHLKGILVDSLHGRLDVGPGWGIQSNGTSLIWHDAGPSEAGPSEQLDNQRRWSVVHDSGLRADVTLDLDHPFNAARLQVTLSNPTAAPSIPLSAIKPVELRWRDLPTEDVRLRALGGGLTNAYYPPSAYRERAVALRPGLSEAFRIESGPDGRSSNRDLPLLQLTVNGSDGGGLVVALEWSAEWYQQLGRLEWFGALSWEAGIPVRDLILAPGEILALPTAHLMAFQGDQDAGGNACRHYLYERICPTLAGSPPIPPVSYDHWFGVGCDFDEEFLRQQVRRSADLGVEYFVLDAGWFAGCGPGYEFSSGVGNWERVATDKFPQGLEPFADYVRSQGLKFGLWFDVERAYRGSDIVQQHPTWFIDIGSDYLHLNMALPAVQDYVIGMIGGWISRLGVEWSRWDYNIGPKRFWDKVDPTGKVQFAYMAGLYHVLDTLMASHPQWLVECCASGGRRIDLGTLRRAHTIWFSDHTEDPLVCRFMQTGANRFLPGHLPNSAVVVDRHSGQTRIDEADVVSRMCGPLAFNGDIATWSPEMARQIARLVGVYKTYRHLLVADFYPLTPQPTSVETPEVVQFVSRDSTEAVILGFSGLPRSGDIVVRPHGLDADADYIISDPLEERSEQRGGHSLWEQGIQLSLQSGAAVRLLRQAPTR